MREAQIETKKSFLSSQKSRINEYFVQRNQLVSDSAFAKISKTYFSRFSAKLLEMKNLNKLPALYQKQLIDQILNDEKCICGRKIEESSTEKEILNNLRETAPDSSYTDKLTEFKSFCMHQEEIARKFDEKIDFHFSYLEPVLIED